MYDASSFGAAKARGGRLYNAERKSDWPGSRGADPGDRIGLLLDLGAGSLAVFLNGEPLGLAVAGGLQPPLRWAVDLQGRGAAARLGRGGRGTAAGIEAALRAMMDESEARQAAEQQRVEAEGRAERAGLLARLASLAALCLQGGPAGAGGYECDRAASRALLDGALHGRGRGRESEAEGEGDRGRASGERQAP
jgi:hypothetical protein